MVAWRVPGLGRSRGQAVGSEDTQPASSEDWERSGLWPCLTDVPSLEEAAAPPAAPSSPPQGQCQPGEMGVVSAVLFTPQNATHAATSTDGPVLRFVPSRA